MASLQSETGGLMNEIDREMVDEQEAEEAEEEEPQVAFFIQITNVDELHRALALATSPVPQGKNVQASVTAFTEWVAKGAESVCNGCQVYSHALGFHHITMAQALKIVMGKWTNQEWNVQIRESTEHPFQAFAMVILATAEQNTTFHEIPNVFG